MKISDSNKKSKNPKILLLLVMGTVLFGLLIITLVIQPNFIFSFDNNPNDDQLDDSNSIVSNISLIVDFGNGTVYYETEISLEDKSPSVFTLMQSIFSIEFDIYGNGYLITSISGIENNPVEDRNWIYWVNNISPNIASSSYILNTSDNILWNYTSWGFT